jgi:hypothetical protein
MSVIVFIPYVPRSKELPDRPRQYQLWRGYHPEHTVLFRPSVQGVLRMTASVHLIKCSGPDITDDRT